MKRHIVLSMIITAATTIAIAHAMNDNAVEIDHRILPAPTSDADFYDDGAPSPAKVELGRLLFFDKILSGNKNISCATCHHPTHATSDGLALSLGEGPTGLGPNRVARRTAGEAIFERVPRNSPALFNLGAREYTTMFHDGRVETDPHGYFEGGFVTPAKWKLPNGLDNVLAAQAMFPVTSPTEMAGQQGENEIANARAANNAAGHNGVWQLLAERLREIPEYVEHFSKAYPGEVHDAADITFVHAANAIAAFEAVSFRADRSPFDRYLVGNASLSRSQLRGMSLFYGKANCASCHSGVFQTDHAFHAIAMPQIGPGKSDGWSDDYWRATGIKAFPEDFGRGRETAQPQDRYKFRTPSLRNVAATGPWGHAGSYDSLEQVIRHHLDPVAALHAYRLGDGVLSKVDSALELVASGSRLRVEWLDAGRFDRFMQRDGWVQSNDQLRALIAGANELEPIALTDEEIEDLVAFMHALTDPSIVDLESLVPVTVPSGLPVED